MASQFKDQIEMCLEPYSAVYYDDVDYQENWVTPSSNGATIYSSRIHTYDIVINS